MIWGEYQGVLRDAILALKHRGRDELARPLAERLAAALAVMPWIAGIKLVTSVPSHALYRVRRGYSAAHLLAAEVAHMLALPARSLLTRRGLGRQAGSSRAQRLRLPAGSFTTKRRLTGPILLIDDVTTTGTTLRRAATALLHGGAGTVFCAALALAPEARRVT